MERIKVAPTYEAKWLEVDRPQPLIDKKIEFLIQDVLKGRWDHDVTDQVYIDFKRDAHDYIFKSQLNKLTGIEQFEHRNIINGCTQFIDNIYMSVKPQVLTHDYRYHQRLGLCHFVEVGSLMKDTPLIIAMPFPQVGAPHNQMKEILDEAKDKNIDVHIDGAWITCCRDVEFDFSHSSIKSVGISLSKGLGLGWNRVGIRYTREPINDSITIMNNFRMNNRVLSKIGLHFLHNLDVDHLWNNHGDKYYKVCNDFNLTPTKSIYLALRDGHPVGLSPLIRHLEHNESK